MKPEDEYRLSFYKEFGSLDAHHNVKFVRHTETGNIYVRKELADYDMSVFQILKTRHFQGIPHVEDFAEDNGNLIVIEEFINGQTLRTILDRKGTLPPDQAMSVLCALCDVLSPLHKNVPPLIHRDIKPENIIITDDSNLYLVDFDASKLYAEGKDRDTELIGTRKYAAPEQYGYAQSDPRTDIYAIGKVGREMVTGDPNKINGPKTEPLFYILDKCTNMDPEDRYKSVDELRKTLDALAAHGVGQPYRVRYPENDADSHIPNGAAADQKEEIKRIHRESAALPGFRTGVLWKKIVASVCYVIMILSLVRYFMQNPAGLPMPDRIIYVGALALALFSWVLLFNDYLGIASRLPLTRSKNIVLRVIGYYLYMVILTIIPAVIISIAGIQV